MQVCIKLASQRALGPEPGCEVLGPPNCSKYANSRRLLCTMTVENFLVEELVKLARAGRLMFPAPDSSGECLLFSARANDCLVFTFWCGAVDSEW